MSDAIHFYTFAPDLDSTKDGILIDCDGVIPTVNGMGAAPSAVSALIQTATASVIVGAASLLRLDNNPRTFLATSNKIFELSSTAWADVSISGGYSSVVDRWRFAQYGNVSIAASRENVLSSSSTAGVAFAKITSTASGSTVTAPAAACIEVVNDFVFLANIATGPVPYSSDQTDRWWCSALGDYTDWTPSIATQCATGRVTSVPGKITAAKKFGDQIVLYKQRGMYLGSYVGGASPIWDFRMVPATGIGTWCQESVADIGTPEQPLHFLVGENDFYLFDGARPIAIGDGIRNYFFARLNTNAADKIIVLPDRNNSMVYVLYPSGGATIPTSGLVYNYRYKRWGVSSQSAEFAFEYLAPQLTYGGLGALYSTYGTSIPGVYGSAFTSSSRFVPVIVNSSTHTLFSLNGTPGTSSFTTPDYGTEDQNTLINRIDIRFLSAPTGVTQLTNYYRDSLQDSPSVDTTISISGGRFDFLRSARFHRFVFQTSGYWESNMIKVTGHYDGAE